MILKISCDTNTLPHNIPGADQKSQMELAAVKQLGEKYNMFRSHLVDYELMNTKDESHRNKLAADSKALDPITNDEKLLGYQTQTDPYGGFVTCPIISDVQNESLRDELIKHGLPQRDAEHITQAICNDCDVFLTRDVKTIIKPHGQWLEERFKLRVWQPSQLLKFLETGMRP